MAMTESNDGTFKTCGDERVIDPQNYGSNRLFHVWSSVLIDLCAYIASVGPIILQEQSPQHNAKKRQRKKQTKMPGGVKRQIIMYPTIFVSFDHNERVVPCTTLFPSYIQYYNARNSQRHIDHIITITTVKEIIFLVIAVLDGSTRNPDTDKTPEADFFFSFLSILCRMEEIII